MSMLISEKLPGQIDPPLAMFGGQAATPEFSRNQRLLWIEAAFLSFAMAEVAHLTHPGAVRHISGGLVQRHLMMHTSRLFIRRKCLEQKGELSPYLASELDVHLNAFYLNLSGGLDNLAWAIAYEHALMPSIDEDNRDSRQFCSITGKRFLDALERVDESTAMVLASQAEWVAEVKELRDPAAHRLPLRFVTGVLTAEQRPEYECLQAEARAALECGDLEKRREVRDQQRELMKFLPFLASPGPDKNGFRVVPNLVNSDQEKFLAIARFVLDTVVPKGAA